MKTINLFPKVIGIFNLERNLNEQELSKINLILQVLIKNTENSISKNKNVLDDSDFDELKKFIDKSIKQYLNEVYCEQTELQITESWLNKTKNGESHHYHCHPNSYISGVFYIKTTDEDKIMFHNLDPRINYYQPIINSWNIENSQSWWLPTPQNSLFLFRSDLYHSVPKTSTDERISLSFNTFIINDFGNPQSATFLPLSKQQN